jgi:hypothetical protein
MPEPGGVSSRLRRDVIKNEAARRIAGSVVEMASELGGHTVTELRSRALGWPGYNAVGLEPIAALEAARELERAARAEQVDYIRLAREAGRSWHEIGEALDLHWNAVANKETIDDEAYSYALRDDPRPGRRTFAWTCPACRELISDKGPWPELPEREEGHQTGCPRRAAELAAWQSYRAGPAEGRAGG